MVLPKRTPRALLTRRVVFPFFVRAPEDLLDHDQTPNAMLTDSSQNVILGLDAIPDILLLIEVTMDNSLVAIVEKDAEYGLRRAFIVGAVESQCRTRKSLISCFRFLPKNGDGLGASSFSANISGQERRAPCPTEANRAGAGVPSDRWLNQAPAWRRGSCAGGGP